MIDDDRAARVLIMISRSQPPSTKQSVVEAIEREDRLSFPVPRQKRRSFPRTSSSSSYSTEIVVYVSKEDPNGHVHDWPLMEYTTEPPRSCKKRHPLFPPMGKQPKKAKHKTDHCLAAGASSSWTTEPTPAWLSELMISKNGAELKKVIKKELKATDVSPDHNRLSMPLSNIIDLKMLSPAEERIIEEDENKSRKTGVDAKLVVKLVDSDDLKEFDVNLRRWKMSKKSGNSTYVYNLVTGWKKVVNDCGLKELDNIRLWTFHSDGKLYFALVPSPPSPHSGISQSEEISSVSVIYDKSNDDFPLNCRLYDRQCPLYTLPRCLPPSSINEAVITDSIIGDGCILDRCVIRGSVVGMRTSIADDVIVEDSIIVGSNIYEMEEDVRRKGREKKKTEIRIGIGEKSRIRRAIVDKNARIGKNVMIINRDNVEEGNREAEGYVIREGIIVILRNAVIPNDSII